jgi:hypothetical protein
LLGVRSMRTLQPARAALPLAAVGLSLLAGVVAWTGSYAAVGAVVVVCALAVVLLWPRAAQTTSRGRLLSVLLILYLVPLLMLGRAFAVLGQNPVYVPDVLIMLAALLMLPKLKLRALTPFPVLCGLIALLALNAVYVGTKNGYPAATKGFILVVYPLLAIVVAGWLAGRGDTVRVLSFLPRYVLPTIPIGLALAIAAHAIVVPASYGLYLGVGAAFAATAGTPRRRLVALSVVVGFALLTAHSAERGPALTISLAALGAWLASNRLRSTSGSGLTVVAVLSVVVVAAFAVSVGVVSPTRVPVVGHLVARATASGDTAAANNVGIRKAMWSYALHTTYTQDPLLGVGAFHPVDLTYFGNNLALDPGTGVHNSFVGYTFYAGFPAGILLILVFALTMWRMWRIRHTHPFAPVLFGALVAVVVTALTNVALETTYIGGPSWLILGAAIAVSSTAAGPSETTVPVPLRSPIRASDRGPSVAHGSGVSA